MNELLGDDLPPWDQGHLHAHRISAGPTVEIERVLAQARRRRRGLLSWVLLGRRRYLEGLIRGLEDALAVRYRERAELHRTDANGNGRH